MSVADKARSAVIWNTGFNLFRDLLQFSVMLVLVRLLQPEAYGQFALVTSVIGFMAIFSFNSFVAHTLQVRDDDDVYYQEHFTAGAVIMCSHVVLTNLLAGALSWLPTYAPVASIVHVMSVTFLLEWPCELRRKMLEREYNWKRLRLLHASGLIVSSVLGVVMAWSGAGVYSLLIPGMTVTLPFILDLFFVMRWRPDWRWSWANYKAAWHFGLNRVGSGAALTGRQLTESAMLAKVLGYASLGIINRALGLAQMFCSKFASQLMYAIYPVLTQLNAEKIARVNGLVLRIVAWVLVPIAVILSALSSPLVLAMYGKQWIDVIPLLPWAMLGGIMNALSQTANGLLLAQQQPRRCFVVEVLVLIGTVLTLFLVLPLGVKFYLLGLATVQCGVFSLISVWLCRSKALGPSGIIYAVLPPVLSASIAYLLCELGRGVLAMNFDPLAALAVHGTSFGLLYLTMLRLLFPRQLGEILVYLPARVTLGRVLVLRSAT